METGLTNRVAVVTGAGSGIGLATVHALADEGARIACIDANRASALSAASDAQKRGVEAVAIDVDVSDRMAVREAMRSARDQLGTIELAVNSAGIAVGEPALHMGDAWGRVVDVDLNGTFYCAQAQGEQMIDNRYGRIVNIASISASIINRGVTQANYSAAKAGVVHLSQALAVEWASFGVRVNSLSPGYTATAMNQRAEVAELVAQFANDTPMQRLAEPSEIASAAVFLLSDSASFITGIDLVVDGGATCW